MKIKSIILMTLLLFTFIRSERTSALTITGAAQEDLVPFLYWLINGPPSTGYPSGYSGPDSGFLGMIRQMTGATALGGGLYSAGYVNCTDIPSSGTYNHVEGSDTFAMTFEAPTKVIPTGFTGADGSTKFSKRVSVSYNSTNFFEIEFNCNATIGWIRFADNNEISGGSVAATRNIEAYYDTNTTSAVKLELAMYYEQDASNKEYMIAKFETSSATAFKVWLTRAARVGGSNSAFRVAINGNKSTSYANVLMEYENASFTDSTAAYTDAGGIESATGGDVQCLDLSDISNIVDGGANCGGLTLAAPSNFYIDTDGDMSIENTSNTGKLKAAMKSL